MSKRQGRWQGWLLGMVAVCGLSSMARAADLSREVRAPSLPGLVWSAQLPHELTSEGVYQDLEFSMAATAVDALLKDAVLPPRVLTGEKSEQHLSRLCLDDSLRFCLQAALGSSDPARGRVVLKDLLDAYQAIPATYSLFATYEVFTFAGENYRIDKRGVPVRASQVSLGRVANFPVRLELDRSELGDLQTLVRPADATDTLGSNILRKLDVYCRTNRQLTEKQKFVCANRDSGAFTQDAWLRIRFRDQEGVARQISFVHRSPVQGCRFDLMGQLDCYRQGETPSDWKAWLRADSYAVIVELAQGLRSGTRVAFEGFTQFIPRPDQELGPIVLAESQAEKIQILP